MRWLKKNGRIRGNRKENGKKREEIDIREIRINNKRRDGQRRKTEGEKKRREAQKTEK